LTYIDPYVAFSVLYSFLPVLMAIFGGMGQIYGPVVGAVIFSYLQETLQTRFPELYMLIFGFVLIATVLFMRDGLVGVVEWAVRKLRRGGSAAQNADT
jgi:branched-chain amino acid transport system permease protein